MTTWTPMKKLATFALLLALFVVMLGAYTRLTDAGLGCPDWPGCYGRMLVPESKASLDAAQANFPAVPLESRKAWTEMIHRYLAGTLGLIIFAIGFISIRKRFQGQAFPWELPVFLMIFVIFQALLGMWTVTLKLLPLVVMAHLLGGMLIVACLARFWLQLSNIPRQQDFRWRFAIRLGVVLVFFQIALGGWVSANYAGIACVGFPKCNGMWWPALDLSEGFYLFSPVGANYQGGLLESDARMTIQIIHRIGALVTAIYVLGLSYLLLKAAAEPVLRRLAGFAAILVSLQFLLGIINVVHLLPLTVAVAHNGVAALLFASMFSMLHFTRRPQHAV